MAAQELGDAERCSFRQRLRALFILEVTEGRARGTFERVVGKCRGAGGFEHLADEQRFELLRDLGEPGIGNLPTGIPAKAGTHLQRVPA